MGRSQRPRDAFALGLGGHLLDEGLYRREADVRLEQGLLDKLQAFSHVRLGQLSLTGQRPQGVGKPDLQSFEHISSQLGSAQLGSAKG